MKKFLYTSTTCFVLAVSALFLIQISRTGLIISFGLRAANLFVVSVAVITGVFAVASITALILVGIKKAKQGKRANPVSAVQIFEKGKPVDPDKIRAELLRLQTERVQLKGDLQRALSQMDSIDRKQAKFKDILQFGAANSVNEVGVTVDETEQVLCKKLMRIVNRAVLWDPEEADLPGKEEIYRKHKQYMANTLDEIDELLNLCDTLLSNTLNYIDEKNSGIVSDGKMALEVMNEVVQSLQNMNKMETKR